MDTKEQAKKKLLDFIKNIVDDDLETRLEENCYSVHYDRGTENGAGVWEKNQYFPFTELKFGDLAWCWFETRKDAMLLCYNGYGWCSTRKAISEASEDWGSKFGNYQLLGINIADKLDSSGTEG